VFDSASSIFGRYEPRGLAISLGTLDWWQEIQADSRMTSGNRKWSRNWNRNHDLKLDLGVGVGMGVGIEDERLNFATTRVSGRCFDRFGGIRSSVNPRLMFNYDEAVRAAHLSRGKEIVALDQRVFRKKHTKPRHNTLGAVLNPLGHGPRPLLCFQRYLSLKSYSWAGCIGARVPLRMVHWPYLRCVC
jgi:hypothetical protein